MQFAGHDRDLMSSATLEAAVLKAAYDPESPNLGHRNNLDVRGSKHQMRQDSSLDVWPVSVLGVRPSVS